MKTWKATYTNPETGNTNTYILTDEELIFMDDIVYVDEETMEKVYDPKKIASLNRVYDNQDLLNGIPLDNYTRIIPCKCVWAHDMNKGYDTLKRTFISNSLGTEYYAG
jgi:hypothetical protein